VPSYVLGFWSKPFGFLAKGRKPQKSGRKFTTNYTGVRQRFYKIIVVLIFTGFTGPVLAQKLSKDSVGSPLHGGLLQWFQLNPWRISSLAHFNFHNPEWTGLTRLSSPQVLGPAHYTRDFGFFCRKELQFEKHTRLPLRFRLGSLEYCDYLEAKE